MSGAAYQGSIKRLDVQRPILQVHNFASHPVPFTFLQSCLHLSGQRSKTILCGRICLVTNKGVEVTPTHCFQALPLRATPQTPNSLMPPIRPTSSLLESGLAFPEKAFSGKDSSGKEGNKATEPPAAAQTQLQPIPDQSRQAVAGLLPSQAPLLQSRGSSHQVIRPQPRPANGSLTEIRPPAQLATAESGDGRGSETPSSIPSPGADLTPGKQGGMVTTQHVQVNIT